ncbi:MAG: biotin--[acetyl-CoA-carboxylase] ligase, partial [Pseudomonadota bacterium]
QLRLKWPNDLMLGEQKLCGILIERAGEADPWHLVIGIGTNLNRPQTMPDAASLADYGADCRTDLNADQLAREILNQVERLRSVFHRGGAMALRQAWLQHAWHRGGHVSCHVDGKRLEGIFDDLDLDGALILSLPDGTERKITGGEVHFLSLSSLGLETA